MGKQPDRRPKNWDVHVWDKLYEYMYILAERRTRADEIRCRIIGLKAKTNNDECTPAVISIT